MTLPRQSSDLRSVAPLLRWEELQEVAIVVVDYRHQSGQPAFFLPDHHAVLLRNCRQLFIRLVRRKGDVTKGLVMAGIASRKVSCAPVSVLRPELHHVR